MTPWMPSLVGVTAAVVIHCSAGSASGADTLPMDQLAQRMKALEFFKDWSNYLLVTTVAALGWLATTTSLANHYRRLCIWLFALSAIFAIFTLALIPIVGEAVVKEKSFYEIWGRFYLVSIPLCLPLKYLCFPQHLLFILGIVAYAYGTTKATSAAVSNVPATAATTGV